MNEPIEDYDKNAENAKEKGGQETKNRTKKKVTSLWPNTSCSLFHQEFRFINIF